MGTWLALLGVCCFPYRVSNPTLCNLPPALDGERDTKLAEAPVPLSPQPTGGSPDGMDVCVPSPWGQLHSFVVAQPTGPGGITCVPLPSPGTNSSYAPFSLQLASVSTVTSSVLHNFETSPETLKIWVQELLRLCSCVPNTVSHSCESKLLTGSLLLPPAEEGQRSSPRHRHRGLTGGAGLTTGAAFHRRSYTHISQLSASSLEMPLPGNAERRNRFLSESRAGV